MLVRDIYGGNYDSLGLDNDLIASSLGKTTRSQLDTNCSREEHLNKFKQEDIVKSILIMICYDLSQLASLHAKIQNVKKVIFGGYFISKNLLTMRFLKHGISYWSQVKNFIFSWRYSPDSRVLVQKNDIFFTYLCNHLVLLKRLKDLSL